MNRENRHGFTKLLLITTILLVTITGCSGRGADVIAPGLTDDSNSIRGGSSNRVLWGMWHISLDPVTLTPEIVPIRGAMFTANVTQFMQPPTSPTNMLSFSVDPSSDPANGFFIIDVILNHPFPGLNMYNGFDVRGILITDGSITGQHDSTVLRAGPGDTRLENADGYSRWWNWTEFTSYETVFGATQGKLAPPYQPSATVNPYKYFADGLGPDYSVSTLDPTSRGFFTTSSPGTNSRRYEIQFKMDGDQTVFDFNYAIDASWDQPDPAYDPEYPVEAFNLSSNCQEAFHVEVTDAGSTAWYVSDVENGGEFILDIEVFDWQGGANDDVPSEISGIYLEGDTLSGVVDVLASASVVAGSTVNSSTYEVTISSLNLSGTGEFELFGTVESAYPTTYEPQTTGGGMFDFPDAPLAAFFMCAVNVSDQVPYLEPSITGIVPDNGYPVCDPLHVTITGDNFIDGVTTFYLQRSGEPDFAGSNITWVDVNTIEGDLVLAGALPGFWDVVVENPGVTPGVLTDGFTVLDAIFVDGDNTGDPLEDGTPDHPFDVIQEGLDAAYASNDEPVVVDQCAVDYSPFTLHDDSHVIGCNWNDGVGWPTVSQTNSYTYGSSVNNATIEGLFFNISINSGTDGMVFSSGDGITITKCKFSGVITSTRGYFVRFSQTNNIEITYSEFTELYNRGSDTDWRSIYVLMGTGVNGYHINHCEFHDIGYDVPDAGAFGNSLVVIRAGYGGGGPHNVDIHNLLIYDIYDKTDCIRFPSSPNPDPQNWLSVFSLSNVNSFDWVGYFYLYNITVDDIRHADPPASTTVEAGHCNAAYMGMVGGSDIMWKNNIASNIEPTDDQMWPGNSSYFGWWVDNYINNDSGHGREPMDYSCVYNIGKPLPPGANTWQWTSGYINQVMAGTGSYQNFEDVDPVYDLTPGANFYHPTNSLISTGADDAGEMGAFGGPEGDWTPPSQL